MYLPKCFVSIESIEELNVNTAVHHDVNDRAKISQHMRIQSIYFSATVSCTRAW